MVKILLVIFLSFLTDKMHAQKISVDSTQYIRKWTLASISKDGQQWYVYKEINKKNSIGVQVWVRVLFPKYKIGKTVYKNAEIKQLITFDCNNNQTRIDKGVVYNSNGKNIEVFETDYLFEDVVPESVIENVIKYVCQKFN